MEEKKIKEVLLKDSQEFRKVFEQHRKLDYQLARFQSKSYLSEEDKWKEKQIKKNKLLLKDRLYRMMKEYGRSLE